LRRARWRGGQGTLLGHDPRAQELADQRQHAFVGHPTAQLGHQQSVVDAAEAVLDVSLDHPLARAVGIDEEPHLLDGVLCSAPGPEAVGARLEVRLHDRLQHELGRHLDDPVAQGGNAETADLPGPALGDLMLTHRQRHVGAIPQRLTQLAQDLLHALLLDAPACLAIDTGGL